MKYVFSIMMLLLPSFAMAQGETDVWQDIYNSLSDLDDFDEEGWNETYEILTNMASAPQNINEATLTDLEQVPLLTEQQAMSIINYRSLYGDLHSMSELSLITSMDPARIKLLKAVFYAAPQSTKEKPLKNLHARNDSIYKTYRQNSPFGGWAAFTLSIPTYKRAGYKDGTYQGSGWSNTIRMRYQTRHMQLGLTAAQDAGEPFFKGTNKKGWDFYSGFVRLKNMGVLNNLVIGHYQVSMGMGLIMNNSYRLSRTALQLTSPSANTTLRGHSSRQENNYLQGVAATIAVPLGSKKRSLAFTPFVSYRSVDATMSKDSSTITTLLTTGYHRTLSEIARRNTAEQFVAGASVAYISKTLRLALNTVNVSFSDSLLPNKAQLYNYYRPTGKHFISGSLSYSYIIPRLHFAGETAISSKARYNEKSPTGISLATANSLRYQISSKWVAFAYQRFYSYKFQSILGKSFGDVSNAQNESGVYVGANTTALRNLSLTAYVDYAYHPWARYGYTEASHKWDAYLMGTYTMRKITTTLRYRYHEQHTLRATMKYDGQQWTTMTQLQGTYLSSSADWGYLVSQAVGYKHKWLSAWCSLAYFDTSDYASRLYMTDRSITYGMPIAMVYGNGIRMNLLAQATLNKHLSLAVRSNTLHYFDRNQISSAHQLIDSSSQTDLQVQLIIKVP